MVEQRLDLVRLEPVVDVFGAEHPGRPATRRREDEHAVVGEEGAEEGEGIAPGRLVDVREQRAAPDEVEAAVDPNLRESAAGRDRRGAERASAECDGGWVEVARGQGGLGEGCFQDPQHAPVAAAEVEDPARRGRGAGGVQRAADGVERRHAGAEVRGEVVPVHDVVGRDLVDHVREPEVESFQERGVAFGLCPPQHAHEHSVFDDREPLQPVRREPLEGSRERRARGATATSGAASAPIVVPSSSVPLASRSSIGRRRTAPTQRSSRSTTRSGPTPVLRSSSRARTRDSDSRTVANPCFMASPTTPLGIGSGAFAKPAVELLRICNWQPAGEVLTDVGRGPAVHRGAVREQRDRFGRLVIAEAAPATTIEGRCISAKDARASASRSWPTSATSRFAREMEVHRREELSERLRVSCAALVERAERSIAGCS